MGHPPQFRSMRRWLIWFAVWAGFFKLASAQSLVPTSDSAGFVQVVGTADNADLNKQDNARFDAYKKALLEVAPVFVESRATANLSTLVSSYNYSEVRGFVEEALPVGEPYSLGNVYFQPYRIKVNKEDLGLEMIKRKIDVKFLYDLVARPRIAIAIEDEVQNPQGQFERDSLNVSRSVLTKYFKDRHRDFVIADREANDNSIEILIEGKTRVSRQTSSSPPRSNDPGRVPVPPTENYLLEISWQIKRVSARETLAPIFTNGMLSSGTSQARLKFVEEASAAAFRELMAYWNHAALRRTVEISFESRNSVEPEALRAKLQNAASLNRQSLQMDSLNTGRIVFSAELTGTVSQAAQGLSELFANEFEVFLSTPSRIGLRSKEIPEIGLRLDRVSFSELAAIVQSLQKMPSVHGVRRDSFENGAAKLYLKTFLTTDTLGLELEKLFPGKLRVTGASSSEIQASWSP